VPNESRSPSALLTPPPPQPQIRRGGSGHDETLFRGSSGLAQVVGATWQLTGTTDFSPCSLDHKINAAVRRTVRFAPERCFCWRILGERRSSSARFSITC
jgi:hypothetical protein